MSARDELMKKYGSSREQESKSGVSGGIGGKVASAVKAATNVKLPEKKPARQTLMERYGSSDTPYAVRARTARAGMEKYRADKASNVFRDTVADKLGLDVDRRGPNDEWREDWLEEFGVRYDTDPESAYSFAKEVNDYLAAGRLAADEERVKKNAARNPVASTIAGLVTSPFGLVDTLDKGLTYLATGEIPQRDKVTLGTASRTITSGLAEHFNEKGGTLPENIPVIGGKGWGDAYSLGNSALQSLVLGNTIGSVGTLATFFGQSASSGMEEIKARGGSDEQAILYGLTSGAVEVLAENLPLERLLKGGDAVHFTLKSWMKNTMKQAGYEGIEEGVTSIANGLADQLIMGDKSNFNIRVQEYMAQGMNQEQAEKEAWVDYANDAAFDFFGGAASGAGSMTVQTGPATLYANNQTRKAYTPEMDARLLELAMATEEGSKPYDMAQKLQGQEKPMSGGQINDLRAVYGQYTEQHRKEVEKASEKYGDQAGAMKSSYKPGQNVQKYDEGWQAAVERGKKGENLEAVAADEKAGYLSDVQQERAWKAGLAAGGYSLLKETGETVKVKGFTDGENGLALELEDGRTVQRREVNLTTFSEELVMGTIEGLKVNAADANALLASFREGDTGSRDFSNGVRAAFQAGSKNIALQEKSLASALSEAQRTAAYELGQKYAGAQTAQAQAAAQVAGTARVPGKVHYDGDVSKLTEIQQTSVRALETVADSLGVQIHLYESYTNGAGQRVYKNAAGKEVSAPNGWYDTATGDIHIDINAGQTGRGTMLFTASHELTHFVKQWSPEKFKVLADFLMGKYAEKGVSVEELVELQQAKAERAGHPLDYDAAFEELVADSMESMLADGDIVQRLAELKQTDKKLWQKLKDKLTELVRKLKAAYKKLKPDSAEGRYVAEMLDAAQELKDLFTEGLTDASRNFRGENAEDAHSEDGGADETVQAAEESGEKIEAPETDWSDWDDSAIEFSRRDNEKTAREGGAKHSLRVKFTDGSVEELKDARDVSDSEMLEYLRAAKAGKLLDKTYIPVRRDTPAVLIDTLKQVNEDVKDLSMVMQVAKARQAMADDLAIRRKRKYGANVRKHALSPEQIIQIVKNLDDPNTIIYQTERYDKNGNQLPNNVSVFVTYTDEGTEGVAVIEFEGSVDPAFVGRERGETAYHIVVTLFSPDTSRDGMPFDYAEELLDNSDNYELKIERRPHDRGATRENHPNTSDELPSNNKLSRRGDSVNTKLSARDSDGRGLSKEQQEYFKDSKVRDADGNLLVMYHGTPNGTHTKFRSGTYFTPNREYADNYQSPNASMLSTKKNADAPKTYEVYLNIKKPFDTRNPRERQIFMQEYYRKWGTGAPLAGSGLPDWTDGMDLQEFIEEMGYDYDGLILDEGATGGYGLEVKSRGLSYVTFSSEQIKDVGNKKPTDDPDIRYSERDPATEKLNRALEKENAAQAEEIKYLRELVRLQGKVTNGTKFTRSSVRSLANQLMKDAGAKGNYLELSELLNGIYEEIAGQDDPIGIGWDSIDGKMQEAAQWLMDHIEVKPDRGEYANGILKDLRGRRIKLNEGQMAEVISRYGSYNNFRKEFFGSFTLAKDGTPLDEVWQELADLYPGTFSADTGDADMPLELADIVERLRETDVAAMEFEMQRDGLLEDLRQKVYDGYWKVSTLYTVADQWQEKVNELKERHRDTMEKLDKARQERDAANFDRINDVRKLREKKNKAIEDLRKGYKESRKRAVEGRKKTALRHRVEKTVKELEKLLLKGDKKRHVKEGMRDFVEEALASATVLFADTYSDEELVLNGIGTELVPEENRLIDETRSLLNRKKELLSDAAIAAESEAVAMGDTSGFDKRMKEIQKLDRQISANMSKLNGVLVRERSRLNKATVGAVLANLSAAYRSLGQSDDLYIRGAAREEVWQHLDSLAETIGGTTARDMTLQQLEDVNKAFRMVLTTVRDANKLFTEGQKQTLSESARMAAMEVAANGKNSKFGVKLVEELKKFGFNNLKPVYFFEHLGSDVMRGLYKGLLDGQSAWAKDVDEARAFYREATERVGFDKWDMEKTHTFRAASGDEFKLNLGQIMSLYAYSRREQARDHIRKGGIVIDSETDIQEVVEIGGKLKVKLKGKSTDATAYNIDDNTLGEIIGKLTKEQKAFVEQMQEYLSDTMGGKGNEVSMKLYGVKLFNEQNYLPIRSAHQYMARAKEQAEQTAKVKNAGFTKSTVQHASNPVVLTPFLDIWADHVNEMSLYHSMTLPLEDLHRVYTFSQTGDGGRGSQSVTAAIENAFGKQATGYIDRLMKDLNGGARVDSTTGIINKSVARFKKGSTFLRASVVVQQPSAILRATALVDSKYFHWAKLPAKWALDLTARRKQHDRLWAECKQYAPIALIKEMGYFDTSVGRSTRDFIQAKEYNGCLEKARAMIRDSGYRDDVFSRAPALADELAWCSIWEAVKREQHDKNPQLRVGSEEFMKRCGERFTEVIDKTQVYDSVLARSANMRSKDTGMKMATAFMAEPTVSANMVADAIIKGKRGDKRLARRAIGSVVASGILNAMLYSIVAAARDDDEDKEYWERYLGSVTGEVFEVVNPLTYLPFGRDIVSLLQGYDVERSDMALVGDLVKAFKALSSDKKSGLEKVEGFTVTALKLFDLPLGNVWQDVKALYNVLKNDIDNQDSTAVGIGYAVRAELPKWIGGGAVANEDQLYEAILSGDTAHEQRVRERYKDKDGNIDEGKVTNARRKGLRKNDSRIHEAAVYLNEGQLLEYYVIVEDMVDEGFFHKDDIVSAIQSEANALLGDTGEEAATKHKSAFKAEHFAIAAAENNAELMDMVKADLILTAMDNGKTEIEAEKSVNTSIKSAVKESFVEGLLTTERTERVLTEYCGMDAEKSSGAVTQWLAEKETGIAYDDIGEAVLDGELSEKEAAQMYRDYGGYEAGEAQEKAHRLAFIRDNPGCQDITVEAVADYEDYCKGVGISVKTFYDAWKRYNATRDIKDEGGKTTTSKRDQVMAQIDAMNLSKQQKDALYFAFGYAESKLWDTPWH